MVRLMDVVSPAPVEAWREVLCNDREAGPGQTPEWLAAIREVGPYRDVSRLYTFDDGRRVVLPLAGRLAGVMAVEESWPFDWGIGGPVCDGPVDDTHVRLVYDDLLARRALRLTVRPGPFASSGWRRTPGSFSVTEHTSYCLDLRGGYDVLWGNFHSRVRRAVRKAERSGLRIEVDRSGRLVDVFDRLYRLSVARWAEQQHEPLALARWRAARANPRRKFAAVARQLGERCAIWIAWYGDEPAAGLVVLRNGDHVRYWRGAMDHRIANPTRANDLLHREVIADACATGAIRYHLGDSRPGSSLAAFKTGFGATPHLSSSYRTERLPLTAADSAVRTAVKRALAFRDG
ncbi:GNAT family N-acetyltransferase [Kribbella sp. WER1]